MIIFNKVTEDSCILTVPYKSPSIYRQNPYWNKFVNINQIYPLGVGNVELDFNKAVDVYNLHGVRIMTGASEEDIRHLPSGLYVIGGKKVLIK